MKYSVNFLGFNNQNVDIVVEDERMIDGIVDATKIKDPWLNFGNGNSRVLINLNNCFAINIAAIEEKETKDE